MWSDVWEYSSGCSVASGGQLWRWGLQGWHHCNNSGLKSASEDEVEGFEMDFGDRLETVFTHMRAPRPFRLASRWHHCLLAGLQFPARTS